MYSDETRASHKTHCCQYWVISPHHSLARNLPHIFKAVSDPNYDPSPKQYTALVTLDNVGTNYVGCFHILINMPSFSFLQNCCPIIQAMASAFSSEKDDLAALLVNKYIG